jgi:hypothetical protein
VENTTMMGCNARKTNKQQSTTSWAYNNPMKHINIFYEENIMPYKLQQM